MKDDRRTERNHGRVDCIAAALPWPPEPATWHHGADQRTADHRASNELDETTGAEPVSDAGAAGAGLTTAGWAAATGLTS